MLCPCCKKEVTKLVGRFVDGQIQYSCKYCGESQNSFTNILRCDNFTPHYDLQVNEFFESKEHKESYLAKKGLFQVSGTASPRQTEGVGRMVCTKGQYQSLKNRGEL